MKTIKILVILYIILTTVICVFADVSSTSAQTVNTDTLVDTVVVVKDSVSSVVNEQIPLKEESASSLFFILTLALSVYEIFARFVPTVKDISILSWIMKLISAILPNFKDGGGKHNL